MKQKAMILAVALLPLLAARAGTKQATICTTYGDDIYDYELDQMIDSVVPPSAKRLIVLTQCYGGDCLDNFTGTNTAVISATSSGQTAKYGGYDDDAANACRPGAGRTGQTVHDAGTAGKHSTETPSTGGGLAPGSVSLEPVTADGAVRSRHVIVYAGMPDSKGRDDSQRDKIKANFAGQANTTVTTVGGEGPQGKWDKHGWKRGLQEAINEAAAAIEAAPDPSKEQFLLFVTDHGDLHNVEHVTTPVPPSNSVVVANVAAFASADFQEQVFDRPGFSITVDIAPFTHEVGYDPTSYTPFFPTDAWRILLTSPLLADTILLTGFEERFIEAEDGIVGNGPDEGVRLFFPMDPALFVDSFFDITYDVEIFNDTPETYLVMEFSQDTGPVGKGESEPGFFLIGENTLIGENDMAYDGHEIIVDNCVATIDGVHVFDQLTLTNNATVTHSVGSMGMALTVVNGVSVGLGSAIDVSAKGYGEREGTTGRSGGSYGGRGQQVSGSSCAVYGSATWPVDLGAGGRYSEVGYVGWSRGGGRVHLRADTLDLDGSFLASGENGAKYAGGGAGGSILIEAGTLTGGGVVAAGGGVSGYGSGAGGGGRVALYYDDASDFDLDNVSAAGSEGAGAGTVLLKNRGAPTAHLKVDNVGRASATDIPTLLEIGSLALGRLTVGSAVRLNLTLSQPAPLDGVSASGAWVVLDGDCSGHDFMLTDTDWTHTGSFGFSNRVTLAGASVLRHGAGYEDGLRIHAATVTVAAAASINVGARGRGPDAETTGRSGGSYGGRGEGFLGASCQTFGDYLAPDETGTGGLSSSDSSRGGGFVGIVADALVLDGSLIADGQVGPTYTGGGSGGGVMIDVQSLSGTGYIRANGGDHGASSSYGGGGGRVAVYYTDLSGFDLSGIECAGGVGGGAGGIYTKHTEDAFGRLTFDNLERTQNSAIPTVMALASNSFDRLDVRGKARLDLTVSEPLDLDSMVASNATVTFTGTVRGPDFVIVDTGWTQTGVFGFSNTVELSGSSVLRHGAGYADGLHIQAKTVTVASASAVDVSSCGTGPKAETTGRSGGSYGGAGEDKYGSACPVYGDPFAPAELGSGGIGPSGLQSVGGGCLRITADVLTLNGVLRANGQDGGLYTGGGSGGAIWVEADVLVGSGSLMANGGAAGASGGGAGGGGRVAVHADAVDAFVPTAAEAKSGGSAAQWGTVLMGVPRTVAVTCTGQGVCDPAGPVVIPYAGMEPFVFNPMPVSLATNGTVVTPDMIFEWVNNGLWRGTLGDAEWLAAVTGQDALAAGFEPLAAGQAVAQPGGGMAVMVNGLEGWRYTLERRESLTEGEWQPVPGRVEILCEADGPLLLDDPAVLPRAFYRVVAAP